VAAALDEAGRPVNPVVELSLGIAVGPQMVV
jgi:hypothetical protein